MNALIRLLRSRRLAVWLISGITAYAFAVTLVPQGDLRMPDVASWRSSHPFWAALTGPLRLHDAWWSPVFLLAAFLLVGSTAVCAWERTSAGRRQSRRWRTLPREYAVSLQRARVPGARSPLEPEDALERVTETLRRRRMRVQLTEGGVWATSRLWSSLSSSVFHWSLVALFVLAALGQLTKWEGEFPVVVGERRADIAAEYTLMTEGPWSLRRDTAREFAVSRVQTDLAVAGTAIGLAADVELYDRGAVVASDTVYSNHLLKHGSLIVHMTGYTLGAVLSFRDAGGGLVGRVQYPFDLELIEKGGRIPIATELRTASGGAMPMAITLQLDSSGDGGFWRRLPAEPQLLFAYPGRSDLPTRTGGVGDTVDLPDGLGTVTIENVSHAAKLFVVEDWSIRWVYAAFIVACLAAAAALLLPPRAVYVAVAKNPEGGTLLRIVPRHRRVDSAYPDLIREAVHSAAQAVAGDDAEEHS